MLRLRDPQDSLWDQLLPPQARTLSAELTAVRTGMKVQLFWATSIRSPVRGPGASSLEV